MNTIKSREHIREAYFKYNIKNFALDTKDELLKIIEATDNAQDLNLFVRISISNEHAEIDLSKKFGALSSEALGLLRLTKAHSIKSGIIFVFLMMFPISPIPFAYDIGCMHWDPT